MGIEVWDVAFLGWKAIMAERHILQLRTLAFQIICESLMKKLLSNIWNLPKTNWIREHCIACEHIWHIFIKYTISENLVDLYLVSYSHIWHVNISKYEHWLEMQSVKVC